MSMTPWNGDITQCLKWLQSNAPRIQGLIMKKAQWYERNSKAYWDAWQANVFNLRTANSFGLTVWCIILGVPTQLFGLQGLENSFAYGKERQNFVWDKTFNPNLQNPNVIGGNFYGAGGAIVIGFDEVRYALLLRYAMLVGNGRVECTNRALLNVFRPNDEWDFAAKKYAYVKDVTSSDGSRQPFEVEYVFGSGLNLSDQFFNLLRATQYGILPQFAGSKIIVTKAP